MHPKFAGATDRKSEQEQKGFTATIYAASVAQPGHPNEDAFFVGRLPGAPLAAVFDGQGNAEGAAKKAVRQLERLYTDSRGKLDWMKTSKLLDSHLLGANKSTMVEPPADSTQYIGKSCFSIATTHNWGEQAEPLSCGSDRKEDPLLSSTPAAGRILLS